MQPLEDALSLLDDLVCSCTMALKAYGHAS